MKIKMGVINKERIKKLNSCKLVKKAIGTVALFSLVFTMLLSSGCKASTYTIENDPKAVYGQLVTSENWEQEFFQNLFMDAEKFKEVLDYISISEDLNNLNLDNNDAFVSAYDKLLSTEQLESLIKEYKKSREKERYTQTLIVQQKLCNQKIFEGYDIGNKYFLKLAKYIASLMYNVDPSDIEFEYKMENGEGIVKFIIGGETYTATKGSIFGNNKENGIKEFLLVDLVSAANAMDDQETTKEEQQKYNKDRNNLIVSANKNASKVFNDALDNYSKNNSKVKK